jgi:hypothetical protein
MAKRKKTKGQTTIYKTNMTYVYCVYPPMLKNPKQLSNCPKSPELSVVLIVFDDVLCEVCTYTIKPFPQVLWKGKQFLLH